METGHGEDWDNVADHLLRALSVMGWTQAELAARAGVSQRYVSTLVSRRPQRITRNASKVEAALGWETSTVRRLRDGEKITFPDSDTDDTPELLSDEERAIWALSNLTRQTRIDVIEHLRQLLGQSDTG